jgi:heterodisulfide reductase subunit A
MKGYVDLDPFLATIDPDRCQWCGECQAACPYDAIDKVAIDGKEVAQVLPALCKGGGVCVPVCAEDAIDLKGYTDQQVRSAITAFAEEVD